MGVKQLYNLVPQTVWVSSSCSRGSENQLPAEGLGPQDPRLSSPAEWERSAAIVRNLGSICCSLFSLQLASHTQPFRIKCERYIFLKNCVCSSLLFVSACIHIVVSRLYNNYSYLIICTLLYGIKHSFQIWIISKPLFWPIAGALRGTTVLVQSGPGSHGNERLLHTTPSLLSTVSRTSLLRLCRGRDAVGIYFKPCSQSREELVEN